MARGGVIFQKMGCLYPNEPKFDFSEEGFCVTSFMSTSISSVIAILFRNDGVSSRRQDKKVGYHGAKSSSVKCAMTD
jgi:hypothetical protein